ncbi:hypothetical protein Tsubulata_047173 [Turnera subulata]|uniref:Uncharacterized protein n=1 Tax=Turnera subulata TaxID=218843 RepID=A0A9Q0GCJ0_9ROSI|nr:hypothetical protein Tsubulata_047173 [Turnera subulata]
MAAAARGAANMRWRRSKMEEEEREMGNERGSDARDLNQKRLEKRHDLAGVEEKSVFTGFGGDGHWKLKSLAVLNVKHGPGFYYCTVAIEIGKDGFEDVAVVDLSKDDQGLVAGHFGAFYLDA